ncbi:acetyl-CoA carboxylase biotin carboxylase subunit [Micromonospora auratinigra]|uniref:biotin carboxylase n=1 Tax=Micromonospora auratinigra TaxID=261654 RepID=A0A1A8ZG67_9ACTN|nr:acetyl-CoA carboxylase biotin carboxylase subunit [Micromonospora auratinigra]SBT42862.1 acetyl-CoA carboxylase, biotin carboxylase subunit [Micromonospora auratinigra]
MFETVLIANRGEIALRVARTCQELGIRVVAVYSTEDEDAAVVRIADEAVRIGPGPARRSYLNIPAIIEAAARTGADAIHPGYGFLSENPDFAEVCAAHGLTFVGPPAPVMARLGDKAAARCLAAELGLPLLPGSLEPLTEAAAAARLADEVGYPVIIKAVAGGGGRGTAVVRDRASFVAAYHDVQATARLLFGDERVYVERFLEGARHVEIQVLCDTHGNAVHLGERDCSVQRRNQKLIEEAPAPGLSDDLLARMGRAAVHGALGAGYVGAGTFEFLVDQDGDFYFMEANCRIQVEHPVTEMVTGIDLVREQLLVAAGRRLGFTQSDVTVRGAAIECRINAEDPARGFVPTPGVLTEFDLPGGPFVRVDTHARRDLRISPAYDPLIAKLIVWAPDREQAVTRMRRALGEFRIGGPGVHTTSEFLRTVLDDPLFRAGKHDTSIVDTVLDQG